MVGAIIIAAWTAVFVQASIKNLHAAMAAQALAGVIVIPSGWLLIAWGIMRGTKQLPPRGYPHRTRDLVVLSVGGAIDAFVVFWMVYTGLLLR